MFGLKLNKYEIIWKQVKIYIIKFRNFTHFDYY